MAETEARAALAGFDRPGGLERWAAEQRWEAAPGGWTVLHPLRGWSFRVEPAPGGVRVNAAMGQGKPVVWFVPAPGNAGFPGPAGTTMRPTP